MREAIINKSDEVMAESEQTVQNIWFDQWQNLMGYAESPTSKTLLLFK